MPEPVQWMYQYFNEVGYFVWLVNWLINIIRTDICNALNSVIIFESSIWTSKLLAGKDRVHLDPKLHRFLFKIHLFVSFSIPLLLPVKVITGFYCTNVLPFPHFSGFSNLCLIIYCVHLYFPSFSTFKSLLETCVWSIGLRARFKYEMCLFLFSNSVFSKFVVEESTFYVGQTYFFPLRSIDTLSCDFFFLVVKLCL